MSKAETVYASSACMSASMPVDAVTRRGQETVRDGSTIASDRPQVAVGDARLRPEAGKVDDRDRRDLGPRAGRRRQRDDRQDGPRHGSSRADRGVDVVEQLAAVGCEERAQFCRVERGAAADPDEAVEPSARGLYGLLHGRLVRLPCDAVVDDRLDAGASERLLEALAEAGLVTKRSQTTNARVTPSCRRCSPVSDEAPGPKTTLPLANATVVAVPSVTAAPRR